MMNVEEKVEPGPRRSSPRPSRTPIPQSIEGPQVRFDFHDLRILDLRRPTVDAASIVATLYIDHTDAGAISTWQRAVTPHSRVGLVDRDGDARWHCDWRCGKWWPGIGHVYCDIPGVRFVEVPRALSAWDVLDPRQRQHVCLGRGVLCTSRFFSHPLLL